AVCPGAGVNGMRVKVWLGAIFCLLLFLVIYENVYLSGGEATAPRQARLAAPPMVSLEQAKLQMILFLGDCKCHENYAAEEIADHRAADVHSRIVRLTDPDRAALMRRYHVDKGPYTVFLNPKNGKVLMTMRYSTFDDFQDALHELLVESGYGFA